MVKSIATAADYIQALFRNPFVVKYKDNSITVTPRFFKASKDDYTEAPPEIYPAITIRPREIRLSEKFTPSMQRRVANVDSENGTATYYYEPALLVYSYDIGVATKDYLHLLALQQYFARFQYDRHVLLDKKIINGSPVGIPCTYTVNAITVNRPDGIFETTYQFDFEVWTEIRQPEDVLLLESLNINVSPRDIV